MPYIWKIIYSSYTYLDVYLHQEIFYLILIYCMNHINS